ncbi:hypothetical protein KRP22_004638 [Phytophthora ramorum]|nr:RxLR effector protein PSR2 [Phytophthora ramorum]
MRLHYVLLLASAALLSTIDASLAIASSKTSTLSSPAAARSLFVEQHNIVSKRLLRAETTADEDEEEEEEGENEEGENEEEDEERGITLPSSATKKIAKLAMSSDEIARIQAKLDRVFKGIQLDKKNSYLFGDANLRKWAQNALNMHGNSETASAAMLSTLTKFYKPADLARWIESAKVAPSVGNLATKLQEAQFTKWLAGGKDALGIRAMLKKASTGQARNPLLARRDEQIVKAFHTFVKQQKGIIV